jgi:hypothetical protein
MDTQDFLSNVLNNLWEMKYLGQRDVLFSFLRGLGRKPLRLYGKRVLWDKYKTIDRYDRGGLWWMILYKGLLEKKGLSSLTDR